MIDGILGNVEGQERNDSLTVMEQMKQIDSLSIREKKQYLGVPETWKLRPICCLSDVSEEEIYYAALEGGSFIGMSALQKVPSFTLYFLNRRGEEILYFEKKSGFFSSKTEVFDATENLIGSIQKQGSKTAFRALDAGGHSLYDIEADSSDPETFQIRRGGVIAGRISRRPTRIAEEGVSSNSHFGIVFPLEAETAEKGLLLGALFVIDLLF